MKLRDTILAEHSKANCNKIVKWIGSDQQRFDELIRLFLQDEYRVVQRASWPLSYVVRDHPLLIRKHLGKILKYIERKDLHDGVKRNTVRLLEEIDIPEKYQGDVMNKCFDYLIDPQEKAAVKASSLTVLYNLSKLYPEIKQELKTIIQERYDLEPVSYRARAKRYLNHL